MYQFDKNCYFSIAKAFSNRGPNWHRVDVNFIAHADFHLHFVSTQGHGEIPKALDDISLSTGSCINIPGKTMQLVLASALEPFDEASPYLWPYHTEHGALNNTVPKPCIFIPGCHSGEFRCASGQCISDSQVCDWKKDCEDSSDEDGCRK